MAIDITDPTELLKPDGTAFSDGTRPVSSPLTVISNSGIAKSFFTLFDPVATGGDCFGRSFIVEAEYAPDPVGGTTVNTTVHSISTGKVSGFALGRDSIVVGISGTGGDEARIVPFADTDLALPGALLEVLNWRELF